MDLNHEFSLLVILIFQLVYIHLAMGEQFTVEIHSGREECFYVDAKDGQPLTVSYVVLTSTHGPLNINFQLMNPEGRPLLTEFQKSNSAHKLKLMSSGVYAACFDNTYSSFSVKHVHFSLILDADERKTNWHNYKPLVPEDDYGMKVKDIEDSVDRVRAYLEYTQDDQDTFRAMETRDRSVAESNFERVNFWSMVTLAVMLIVGAIQVLMVKSLFDQKYDIVERIRKYFK